MAEEIHVPTLLARSLGISNYVANSICAEAIMSVDDSPVALKDNRDRFWLKVGEDDWGKKLTVKGRNNTYVVPIKKFEENYER